MNSERIGYLFAQSICIMVCAFGKMQNISRYWDTGSTLAKLKSSMAMMFSAYFQLSSVKLSSDLKTELVRFQSS